MSKRAPRSLLPWLVLALLVHAVALGVWQSTDRCVIPRTADRGATADLEVWLEGDPLAEPPTAAERNESSPSASSEPALARAERNGATGKAAGKTAGNRVLTAEHASDIGSDGLGVAVDSEPTDNSALSVATPPVDDSAEGDGAGHAGYAAALGGEQPTTPPAGPNNAAARSLSDLGYGSPNAHALRPYLNVAAVVAAQQRLDQTLAQGILDRDRDISNGIEGPITTAIHRAALAVVVPDSLSKLAIVIDADGKLADIRIVETNHSAQALVALSDRVRRLLSEQRIRVPGGRAVEFIYEVKSEVLLPSGSGPGLEVDVLGIPLKKGRSDKSGKIAILTPVLKFERSTQPDPDRNGQVNQTPPQLAVGIPILTVQLDPVDIGAPERQVVHTRLIRQRVL